ncbi:MAG: flagellar motor switch protein FliN [Terracidiphilus sp.]|jgi:flagellar motor switch protein FliN/FliY
MENQGKKKTANVFAAAFAESLSTTLASAIGSPWPLEAADSMIPPATKDAPVHFRLAAEGALHGDCFVVFYEEQVADLMAKISKQPSEEVRDETGEELPNLIAAAAQTLAESLEGDYGKVSFKVDRVSELAFGGMFVIPLISSADATGTPILLYFDGELLDGLSPAPEGVEKEDAESRGIHPHNLKLVMDVELNVSLRFGQRQLPLREVLELSSGSVIELDRLVDEPVDLFLDGKLIARGEAVIVDGNYGLRVTEIPQPVSAHLFN